jgi:hypothetical protein
MLFVDLGCCGGSYRGCYRGYYGDCYGDYYRSSYRGYYKGYCRCYLGAVGVRGNVLALELNRVKNL